MAKKDLLMAIRAKCLDCCAGQMQEVKLCIFEDCPLYLYRRGKDPNSARVMTDEQRQAAARRLRQARLLSSKTHINNVENQIANKDDGLPTSYVLDGEIIYNIVE